MCANLPHHAPCIINLNTGELLELAEEQLGGTFSFVRGAGVEGYRLGAESITIKIPVKADRLDKQYFFNNCRELLADYRNQGYALVDLKDTTNPVIYSIATGLAISFRCYNILANEAIEGEQYKISVIGTLE